MQIFQYNEIDSTNLEAKRLIAMGQIHGKALITTQNQTHGRGRLERTWHFQQGNLAFSCIFPKAWVKHACIPLCTCIGILYSLSNTENTFFKWTNDLLISTHNTPHKFGGILIEQTQDFIIIGIGINKNHFPSENTRFPATSLKQHNITILSEEQIFENILKLLNTPTNTLINLWNQKSFFTNKLVEINGITGIFKGVDPSFNALLDVNQTIHTIYFGDTTPLNTNI